MPAWEIFNQGSQERAHFKNMPHRNVTAILKIQIRQKADTNFDKYRYW